MMSNDIISNFANIAYICLKYGKTYAESSSNINHFPIKVFH